MLPRYLLLKIFTLVTLILSCQIWLIIVTQQTASKTTWMDGKCSVLYSTNQNRLINGKKKSYCCKENL